MSDSQRPEVIYRCPVCFSRENDVYLFRAGEIYYCVKCSFTGSEAQLHDFYADLRKKYKWIQKRLVLEDQRKL
jgi:hypothetical protein